MVVMENQKQNTFGVRDSDRFIRIYNKNKSEKNMQILKLILNIYGV